MKIIYLIPAFILFFLCCESKHVNNDVSESETIGKDSFKTYNEFQSTNNEVYSAEIVEIDSTIFKKLRKKAVIKTNKFKTITDITKFKKLKVKNVYFRINSDDTSSPNIELIDKIVFKNGKVLDFPNLEFYYKAYFPEMDILVLQEKYGTNLVYNLSNGKSMIEIGNPYNFVSSPKNKFRLNGYFENHECCDYFIEKNDSGNFKKIIIVNQVFVDACFFHDEFWLDDNNLYFINSDIVGHHTYFRLRILEKK